jgi:hypothetical protein
MGRGDRRKCLAAARRLNCWRSMGWVPMGLECRNSEELRLR